LFVIAQRRLPQKDRFSTAKTFAARQQNWRLNTRRILENANMNRIIWIVGAVVIVLFLLGYFGLR